MISRWKAALMNATVLASALLLGAASPAATADMTLAQAGGGMGSGMMQGGTGGNGAGPGGRMWGGAGGVMPMMGFGGGSGQMIGYIDGRIAFLKAELKLSDKELPLWSAFADALRDNAQTMNTVMASMMAQHGTASTLPDRLDFQESVLTVRLDALRKTKTALAPLYAVLTDEQKRTLDSLAFGPMGGAGGML